MEMIMPAKIEWTQEIYSDICRASFAGFELMVAESGGSFDVLIANPSSGETLWSSDRSYAAISHAKRGAIAAAKRLVSTDICEPEMTPEAEAPEEIEVAERKPQPVPLWQFEAGRYFCTLDKGLESAHCAILPVDLDFYLGFIRIRNATFRTEYEELLEAKRALLTRASVLLEQVLPDGVYSGGL